LVGVGLASAVVAAVVGAAHRLGLVVPPLRALAKTGALADMKKRGVEHLSYFQVDNPLVYALDDLKAWADRGTKTSTSDPGAGTVLPAKRHTPAPYAGKERR